ncbi:hypothetical protein X975_13656, partial [Stegodyphus mimosarum]
MKQNSAVSPNRYLKYAHINNGEEMTAIIDMGSSSCLLKQSVARKLNLIIKPDVEALFGFGNQSKPAARTLGKVTVNLEIDNVEGKDITVLIVEGETQPCNLLVSQTWIDLPHIAYAKIGNTLYTHYANDCPFSQLQNDITLRELTEG